MTSHLDLTDRDQEDHPAYGPLSQPNLWAGFQTLAGGASTPQLAVGTIAAQSAILCQIGQSAPATGIQALTVDLGIITTHPWSAIVGIGGKALSRNAANVTVFGLDYAVGLLNVNLASAIGNLVGVGAVGGARVLSSGVAYRVGTPLTVAASISLVYGYDYQNQVNVTAHRFLYDLNPPTATDFSMHRSSLQLFSFTPQLGSGAGVLGIANAFTNPSTNPTGGGVLYASAGGLYWRGSAGTVTPIAPA